MSQRCALITSISEVYKLINISQLDDAFQDTYRNIYGKAATGDMLTFLRREVMQAVWELLLDDEFMDAYINGIVMQCSDGILRRIFPRFFTYSADYPEKCVAQFYHTFDRRDLLFVEGFSSLVSSSLEMHLAPGALSESAMFQSWAQSMI